MRAATIVFIFGIVIYAECVAAKQRHEIEIEAANECKESEGATDDDMECFNSYDLPSTSTGKCLHACIQEKFGLVKDGEVVPDAIVNHAKEMYGDNEAVIAIAENISVECASVTHEDHCELAALLMKCVKEVIDRHHVDSSEEAK